MNITLRPWRMEDVPRVYELANNKKIAANLRDAFPYPYRLTDAEDYLTSCISTPETTQCPRAILMDGQLVGSIGLFLGADVYRKSAELGYWLGEPYWGQGIMTEAIRQLCAYGFSHYDIQRIYAEPFAHNQGSRRCLHKAGFLLEGILRKSVYKNGKILDSCVYALLRD